MNLRELFGGSRSPEETNGLQKGDRKKAHTKEIVFPPCDGTGRFIPDRSRKEEEKPHEVRSAKDVRMQYSGIRRTETPKDPSRIRPPNAPR